MGWQLAALLGVLGGCLSVPAPGGADGDASGGDIPGPTDGLVAYWSMDSIDDGVLVDAVGGHHGECLRCPLPYAAYVGAGALRFTGDDVVIVPASTAFELTSGSVSAWIYLDHYSNAPTILALPIGATDGNSYLLSVSDGGALGLEYPTGSNATQGGLVPVMEWSHVAASWGPDGTALYVDGTRVEVAPEVRTFETAELLIGADHDAGGYAYFWTGAIDDLRLYDRELSLAEVGAILGL